jgi:peptidoglycan biosynthesis protein MviN/MurJ (putative lipid II flippase)
MKDIPKFRIYINFFIVFIAFFQAYNNWGDKVALSYFFLIGGVVILILNFIALYNSSKNRDKSHS